MKSKQSMSIVKLILKYLKVWPNNLLVEFIFLLFLLFFFKLYYINYTKQIIFSKYIVGTYIKAYF